MSQKIIKVLKKELHEGISINLFNLKVQELISDNIEQFPLREVWAQIIRIENPDLEFIKRCKLVPQVGSNAIYYSCNQSILNKDVLNKELIQTVLPLVKKRQIILKELELFATSVQHFKLLLDDDLNYLEQIYQNNNPQNPFKFRYLVLRSQLEYAKIGRINSVLENERFYSVIKNNIDNMLLYCPDMLKKTLKFKDSRYQQYIKSLFLHEELNLKLPDTVNSKKLKI